ncbi:tetratricopeptide repeat protein [Echinicola jeungdonensis]|uniref:Tetratricopeptide repeat protein n=1 Tax=Echinicola jeungdonensis TaxID=709343 RepID=A0ABV5J6P9_9BACT|nr:tetratricopeptide repeat protein [Echinicola jeungdonensis]MDN3669246.1 tetratricopeptide repeat protein [Echinicola jeungdonensis]
MKKSQVILLIVVIIAVGILYSLPRVVVDNTEENENFEQVDTAASASAEEIHSAELSLSDREKLAQLSAKLEKVENKEKFAIFADSIASFYVSSGMYDSAAYVLAQRAEKFPEIKSWEKAGNAYYEAFGFAMEDEKATYLANQTRKYLNKVLENDPSRLDLKTKVAMTYVSSSNPMQGIMMIREILEKDPQNREALFNMGILSMQSGQYKKAVGRFEDLVKYHPDHIQGQFYLGVSYFESKQKNKAKEQFQKVKSITDDPMIISSVDNYLGQL